MVSCATVAANLALIAKDTFVISEIWRRLLKTIVVRESSLNLVHVETSVQVIKAVLLKVLVEQRVAIHLAIDTIVSNNIRI